MENQRGYQEQQAWIHWEYAPDEWAQLDLMDWAPIRQRYRLTFALGVSILVIILALGLVFLGAVGIFVVPILLVLGLVLFFVMLPSNDYRQAKRRHQARLDPAHPHWVTLARQGLWGFGPYFPFEGTRAESQEINARLNKVWLTTQPTTLHFLVEHLKLRLNVTQGTGNVEEFPVPETIHLLVPAGHESEAEQVAHRFQTEVIEERNHALQRLQDEQTNPPEPS